MNYADKTLVRLADPATRAALFDQTSLGQILTAAYDVSAMPVQGPFTAVFDELSVGVTAPPTGTLEGSWNVVGAIDRTEASFQVAGVGQSDVLRIGALWRGAVVARFPTSGEPITDVTSNWPDLGSIDEAIETALGSLPSDPATLEAERRTRLEALLEAGMDQPAALSDATVDAWLESVGVESVGDLLTRFAGSVVPGTVTVTFAPPVAAPATPRPLPVTAALLVRDSGFSVTDLLVESRLIRQRIRALGAEQPPQNGLRPRDSVLVAWIVPPETFNDADWPGANVAARRAGAGAWLAREGIGLVVAA